MKREDNAAGVAGSPFAAQAEATIQVPSRLFFRLIEDAISAPLVSALANVSLQRSGVNAPVSIGAQWQGGTYAGLSIHDNRQVHLILLPGDKSGGNWKSANEWAEEQGGTLPSRFDQLVLLKNLRGEFEKEYYWSSEQHAENPAFAWCQGFGDGSQGWSHVSNDCRARAVRRLVIQ